jgi:hypothetical protein
MEIVELGIVTLLLYRSCRVLLNSLFSFFVNSRRLVGMLDRYEDRRLYTVPGLFWDRTLSVLVVEV